jgi:hypothetical protein
MKMKTIAIWILSLSGAAVLGGGLGLFRRELRKVEEARPTLSVERISYEGGWTYALVKFENFTPAHVDFERVGFRCTFFSGRAALDDTGNITTNLRDRGTTYEKVGTEGRADRAECRVTWVKLA